MNLLPEKKYGVPSQNFVQKNVVYEKGDEITRFDGSLRRRQSKKLRHVKVKKSSC
jgi:hypothetical protein